MSEKFRGAINRPLDRRNLLKFAGLAGVSSAFIATTGCSVVGGGAPPASASAALTVGFPRSFDNLDPHGSFAATEQARVLSAQIYDTLVNQRMGEVIPRVAVEWENPSPTTWRFHLREDAKFHDGSPLTAESVAASIERQAAAKSPLAALWKPLKKVTAENPKTLLIETNTPTGTILSNLSLLRILPEGQADKPGFFNAPVGSGPFKVDKIAAGDRVDMSANDAYWEAPPKMKRLTLRTMSEEATRVTALEAKEIQLSWPLPADQLQRLGGNKELVVSGEPSYQNWFSWFNCSREPFTDPRVRRALWHAVDIETLVPSIFGDAATVATAPIPSSVFGYAKQEPYKYDVDLARKLLREAGLGEGFSTHIMWNQTQAPQIRQVAEALISSWREINVTVEAQELEEALWLERLLALDWDMELQTNVTATGDADYTLGRLYQSDAKRMGYANPELDTSLKKARESLDRPTRAQHYDDACRIIWKDAVGIFPLDVRANYASSKNMENFVPTPDGAPSLNKVSWSA